MPHNHVAPLIDSIMQQEVSFWTVGPFRAMDPIFPGLPGDLELFTAEEVAKLKELGVFNPPTCLGACNSSLRLCPPVGVRLCLPRWAHHLPILIHMELDSRWQLIRMRNPSFLIVTRTITPTQWTAVSCGASTLCAAQIKNRNHGPLSAETKMDTSLATRTATKIVTGNVRNPKRAITNMVQISLVDALHSAKTTMVPTNVVVMANARDCMGMIIYPTATKQSRDRRQAPVHRMTAENHAPLNVDLFRLHPCSTQHL